MTKVFTANVFLSTSREAISKFLKIRENSSSFKEFSARLTDDEIKNSIIVSPENNHGLVELSYSLNTQGSNSSTQLDLKFVEMNRSFEDYFMSRSTNANLLASLIGKLLTKESPVDIKRGVSVDEVTSHTGESVLSLDKMFFSFGVGDDVSKWAGPFQTFFFSYDIFINDAGAKEINIKFKAPFGHLFSNAIELQNEDGIDGAINTFSRAVTANSFPMAAGSMPLDDLLDSGDLTGFLVELIKKYLGVVTSTNNFLIVLPDLSNEFRKASTKRFGYNDFTQIRQSFISEISKLLRSLSLEVIETSRPVVTLSPEENIERRGEQKYEVILRSAEKSSIEDYRTLPDFFEPINRLLKAIQDRLKTEVKFILQEENNLDIIELWHQFGFVENSSDSVVVLSPEKFYSDTLHLGNVFSVDSIISETPNNSNDLTVKEYEKYTNKSYKLAYYERFLKFPIVSSFNEGGSDLSDLSLDEDILNSYSELDGIPIFKHNIQNGNVLSLVTSNYNIMAQLYNFGIRKKIRPVIANLTNQQLLGLTSQDRLSRDLKGHIDLLFKENPESLNQIYDTIYKFILGTVKENGYFSNEETYKGFYDALATQALPKDSSLEDVAQMISLLYAANLNVDKPFLSVNFDDDDVAVQKDVYDFLQEISYETTIRSLPFFSLSGGRILNKKCILLSAINSLIGNKKRVRLNPQSGFNIITGFRHVINSSECFSEFNLVKVPNSIQVTEKAATKEFTRLLNGALSRYESSRDPYKWIDDIPKTEKPKDSNQLNNPFENLNKVIKPFPTEYKERRNPWEVDSNNPWGVDRNK